VDPANTNEKLRAADGRVPNPTRKAVVGTFSRATSRVATVGKKDEPSPFTEGTIILARLFGISVLRAQPWEQGRNALFVRTEPDLSGVPDST
jgi:hypothetical protein